MDGVVGLSQCAIGPSESYTYRFRIDDMQFGTFWHVAFLTTRAVAPSTE
jgi:FtsP/CotA-like multicopper oxidase with cupredoxin domain